MVRSTQQHDSSSNNHYEEALSSCFRFYISGVRDKILDFKQRLEIAIDIAHGLAYLHLYSGKQKHSICKSYFASNCTEIMCLS